MYIDFQIVAVGYAIPEETFFQNVVEKTLTSSKRDFELLIRLVEAAESRHLNNRYRHRNQPTNVLSFPPSGVEEYLPDYIGDIVMCPSVIEGEACKQSKPIEAHWAHMTVHGVLHLLGLGHETEEDALIMEDRERRVLSALRIVDPYQ